MGPTGTGWTALIDPHFEFGDSDADLRRWSVDARIARLQVIAREGFSHATVWTRGTILWEMSFEAELDDQPSIGGQFPHDLDALADILGTSTNRRSWFRASVLALQRTTGWRPHPTSEAPPMFTELIYPRPAGVAAALARDLGHA